MRNLAIYNLSTGDIIPLAGQHIMVVDVERFSENVMRAIDEKPLLSHIGYRLDNHNMGHLFFGDPA